MVGSERYFLRVDGGAWRETSEQEWREVERACGFRPTAGFSAHGVQGRIYYSTETIPTDVLPPGLEEKTEYRWFTRIAAHEDHGRQYGEQTYEARTTGGFYTGRSPEEIARLRAAYWRDRLGPDVKIDVLRQRIVTYPKEVVDG